MKQIQTVGCLFAQAVHKNIGGRLSQTFGVIIVIKLIVLTTTNQGIQLATMQNTEIKLSKFRQKWSYSAVIVIQHFPLFR
mmetsp:Transcript_10940/g.14262  ORF Transcript_10940/g.14262 Transcript_10940/m.14262 type:complete len:80 (-) Transcript_10940:1195-1434(-)